jgi:hypothetical protein
MKVGEIFIQLGFQSVGQDEAKGFQSIVDAISESSARLADSINAALKAVNTSKTVTEAATETATDHGKALADASAKYQKSQLAIEAKNKALETNKKKTQDAGKSTKQWVSDMNRARLQLVGVTAAITFASKKAADYAQALNIFSNTTGLSSRELQKWEQRAAAAGISAEEMAATVRNLQKLGTDVMMGQGNTKPWAFLGIPASQNPFDTLERIKAKMGTLPRALESRMLEEMGLTDAMQSFLREADKLPRGDEGLLLSEAELKRLKQFHSYFSMTMDTIKRFLHRIGGDLAPFSGIILEALTKVTSSINIVTAKLADLDHKVGRGAFFKALAVGALMLTAALFPLSFALGGVMIIADDLIRFLDGKGKTVIGFYKEAFSTFKDTLESIPALLAAIVDTLTGGVFTKQLQDIVGASAGWLKQLFGEEGFKLSLPTRQSVPKTGEGFNLGVGSIFPSLAGAGLLSPGKTQTNQNSFNITVNGAKSPEDTAKAVGREVNRVIYQSPVAEGTR